MEINQKVVDVRYRSSSYRLKESDSSTINWDISSCDITKDNEVIHLVNQASSKSINETPRNLIFEIKKLKIRNPNEIIIGNLNIN